MAAMLEGDTTAEADALADEAKKDETDSGTPIMIFDLQDELGIAVVAPPFEPKEKGSKPPDAANVSGKNKSPVQSESHPARARTRMMRATTW